MPCPNASHPRNGFCEQKRSCVDLSPTFNCRGTASRLYNSTRCNRLRPLTHYHHLGNPLAQPPSSLSLLPKLRNSPKPEPCLEKASDNLWDSHRSTLPYPTSPCRRRRNRNSLCERASTVANVGVRQSGAANAARWAVDDEKPKG